MFVDKVNIKVQAGKGGDGAIAFLREKYRPNGGPAGGDGGRGGSIFFRADSSLNTLMDFKYLRIIKANNGENGRNKHQYGKASEDVYVKVPIGTIVKNNETNLIIADFDEDGKEVMIAKGGRGGRGNAKFSTSTNQAPRLAENGTLGEIKELSLELMLIADVGLVGMPNAGKSTLLNALSNARAPVADYPFTTLVPNLGVVRIDYQRSFVLADLPGLIEGASSGKGLGLEFLRHIERCRVLLHVIDITAENPMENYQMIKNELSAYNLQLNNRPTIIVLNKADSLIDEKVANDFIAGIADLHKVHLISALDRTGLAGLMDDAYNLLVNTPKFPVGLNYRQEMSIYDLNKKEEDFVITHPSDNKWIVKGERLERIYQKINLTGDQGFNFLMMIIREMGIEAELVRRGIKELDEVVIVDYPFEYFS